MHINVQRLVQRLGEVNKFGALPGGGVSRPSLSTDDKLARDWLCAQMQSLGLEIQVDQIGNIFGIWKGKHDAIIGTGSHLDTVPTGGCYDGALGVVAGLEVFTTLKDQSYQPVHTLVLANFTNEEGTRFTPDMMGSLAYANPHQLKDLYASKATDDGQTVLDELRRIGYEGQMKCGERAFKKFVELHIEQGPILENGKIDIGAVEGVQAIHWKRIIIEGRSAHAGTTPISLRKDTFYATGCMAAHARELCSEDQGLLITIGSVQIFPNVINVVPKKVIVTVDVRHPMDVNAAKALKALGAFTKNHPSFEGLSVQWEDLVDINAVKFDSTIVDVIENSCRELGYSSRRMISGAGHDAQLLSSKYPSAMIFIPSRDGVSHAVDEYSSDEQVERGANVLLRTLVALDKG